MKQCGFDTDPFKWSFSFNRMKAHKQKSRKTVKNIGLMLLFLVKINSRRGSYFDMQK